MTAQLDLFGAPLPPPRRPVSVMPAPPRPPLPELFPEPPTVAWARRLTECGPDLPTHFLVSPRWTGVIVETLARGPFGRWMLDRDGNIREIPADPGCTARIVYLTPAMARDMHARRPLIQIGPFGTHCATHRLATPAEAATAVLMLPVGDVNA